MRQLFLLTAVLAVMALAAVIGLSAAGEFAEESSGVIGPVTQPPTATEGNSDNGWPVTAVSGNPNVSSIQAPPGRTSGDLVSPLWQPQDGCASGVSVVSHPTHLPADPWNAATSDLDIGYYVYDNFTGGGWITAVKFWGITADPGGGWFPCVEDPLDVGIGFFENAGGTPGPTIAIFYATAQAMPTGYELLGQYPLLSWTVVLDTPIYVEEGLFSVVGALTGTSCNFIWMSGTGGDGHSIQWDAPTSTYNDHYYDQSFCLVTAGCPAYTNFSQPPAMPDEFPLGWTSDGDISPQQWCVYESVPDCYMESIRFWGVHSYYNMGWTPCFEDPTTFEIKFYYDAAGEPGTLYESFTVALGGQPTGLYYWSFTSELFEYEATFELMKVFEGWVSIQAVSDPYCHFLWVSSPAGYDNLSLQWNADAGTYTTHGNDMALCIMDEPPCCGRYTDPWGYTGNTNCSPDGKITLSDISRLIDHVYVSKLPLCCHKSGNVNGSLDGNITLSDISRLIDNVYISKLPTALCHMLW